jgi:hypothetical protein
MTRMAMAMAAMLTGCVEEPTLGAEPHAREAIMRLFPGSRPDVRCSMVGVFSESRRVICDARVNNDVVSVECGVQHGDRCIVTNVHAVGAVTP